MQLGVSDHIKSGWIWASVWRELNLSDNTVFSIQGASELAKLALEISKHVYKR